MGSIDHGMRRREGGRGPPLEEPTNLDGGHGRKRRTEGGGAKNRLRRSTSRRRGIEWRPDRFRFPSTVLFGSTVSDHKNGLDNDGY